MKVATDLPIAVCEGTASFFSDGTKGVLTSQASTVAFFVLTQYATKLWRGAHTVSTRSGVRCASGVDQEDWESMYCALGVGIVGVATSRGSKHLSGEGRRRSRRQLDFLVFGEFRHRLAVHAGASAGGSLAFTLWVVGFVEAGHANALTDPHKVTWSGASRHGGRRFWRAVSES